MILPHAANERILTLLNRPIELDGGIYKIPTTVKAILSNLSSSLQNPTLTLFGSAVPYLVDGDYCLSRQHLPESEIGGYRSKPHDFDFSLFDPQATYEKRDAVFNHFSYWLQGQLRASDDPRVLAKQFASSRWNPPDGIHSNTFLFFSLKDTQGRRYDIRIVQKLELPYLFSIEQIQVVFDQTFKSIQLSPDEGGIKESLLHWNLEVAKMHRIDLMDPLAWVKMIQKMGRGFYFEPAESHQLTQRALEPTLWPLRNITSISDLVQKGVDEKDYIKTIHFLFHAARSLKKVILKPGKPCDNPFYNWLIEKAFVNTPSFMTALSQLSFFATWAALKYPSGNKGIYCKRFNDEVRIRLGDKRSDLSFFVPVTATSTPPNDEGLGSLFGFNDDAQILRQIEEIVLARTPDADYFNTFERFKWSYETLPQEVIDKLFQLKEFSYLQRCYRATRGTENSFYLLRKLKEVPFREELLTHLHPPFYHQEILYLAHHYQRETAEKIGSIVPLETLIPYLTPCYDSPEAFLISLHHPIRSQFNFTHLPAYSDEPSFTRTYLNPEEPHLMAFYYKRWLQVNAYRNLDDQLATLLALKALYPDHPDWLKNEIYEVINCDIKSDVLYFYHWNRAIPMLKKGLPETELPRERICGLLLDRNQPRHLIHLFSLLANWCDSMSIENYYKRMIRALSKISADATTLKYLFEGALGVLEVWKKAHKSTHYFELIWRELNNRFNTCTDPRALYHFILLKMKYFQFFYVHFQASRNCLPYFESIIDDLEKCYTQLNLDELQPLAGTLGGLYRFTQIPLSKGYDEKIIKFATFVDKKESRPCVIL